MNPAGVMNEGFQKQKVAGSVRVSSDLFCINNWDKCWRFPLSLFLSSKAEIKSDIVDIVLCSGVDS